MNKPLTWYELSALPLIGLTPVVFTDDCEAHLDDRKLTVTKGTRGHVLENGLNEIWCSMLILIDNPQIRGTQVSVGYHLNPAANVHDEDGEMLPPERRDPEDKDAEAWFAQSPIALVEDEESKVSQPLYIEEFGEEFRPAQAVLNLLQVKGVEDASWHNDVCPHFEIALSDDSHTLEIWFDHPVAEEREMQGSRYSVGVRKQGEMVGEDYVTDDGEKAATRFMEVLIQFHSFGR